MRRSLTPLLVVGGIVAGVVLYQRSLSAAPASGLGITPGWNPRTPITTGRPAPGGVAGTTLARTAARAWAAKYRTTWKLRAMADFYAKYPRVLWPVITQEFDAAFGPRVPQMARAMVDYLGIGKP